MTRTEDELLSAAQELYPCRWEPVRPLTEELLTGWQQQAVATVYCAWRLAGVRVVSGNLAAE